MGFEQRHVCDACGYVTDPAGSDTPMGWVVIWVAGYNAGRWTCCSSSCARAVLDDRISSLTHVADRPRTPSVAPVT